MSYGTKIEEEIFSRAKQGSPCQMQIARLLLVWSMRGEFIQPFAKQVVEDNKLNEDA